MGKRIIPTSERSKNIAYTSSFRYPARDQPSRVEPIKCDRCSAAYAGESSGRSISQARCSAR